MAVPLLATKLFLPPARTGRVPRTALLHKLDDLLRPEMRLALISAPAGFGKTSLLAEWISRQNSPSAWLALDSGDNTPGIFLAYLLAALQRAYPASFTETAALLRAQPPAPLETILACLLNELAPLNPEEPLIIALDDFQFVSSAEVRRVVAFMVEHLPPGVRMTIATRSDPPLPLARLRARNQMVELRAADLRFTALEAAEFLRAFMDVPPHSARFDEMVTAVHERTEGWAAGLQMAGLALKASGYETSSLKNFSGSHRFVLDYLAEEVLAHLPEEVNAFLLQTAPLGRFNADLCAAVIDAGSSPISPTAAGYQHVIEELEKSNLFIIPLDSDRNWFRYHHLLADLLKTRLKQTAPGQITRLHQRAAGWFEANHLTADAIQHALAAAETAAPETAHLEYQQAARLVEENTINLFRRGELHGLETWVSLLPESLADQRPWLCLYRAWIANFAGQLAQVEPLLQKAETHLHLLDEAGQREMEGQCAAARCYGIIFQPDPTPVFTLAAKVTGLLPPDAWARGVCDWAAAFVHRAQGRLAEAETIFERLARTDRASGDAWGAAMTGTDWCLVLRLQGRLREAMHAARWALETVERSGARRFGYTGRLLTAFAAGLLDQNDLAAAARYLEEAVELNQLWRNPNHLVYSYNVLARVRTAQAQFSAAADLLEAARQVLRDQPVLPILHLGHQAAHFHLQICQGTVPTPDDLEEQVQAILTMHFAAQPYLETRELKAVQAARLLLAQRNYTQAIQLSGQVEYAARQGSRGLTRIEILAIKALGLAGLRQMDAARQALREAVTLAAPEGIIRPIVDADPLAPGQLRELLAVLHNDPALSEFTGQFLNCLPEPAPKKNQPPGTSSPAPTGLVEPLTGRELEVLRLLAEGLTNIQIAARLYISAGTVKAHTASIFRKLDAANRTQAVALAREAGVI